MQSQSVPYEKQIFVCTNDRKGEKPSCGDQNGEAVFQELRRIAKERGLSAIGGSASGGHPRIRVAQAKCLGQCNTGVNIMVYSRCPLNKNSEEIGTPTSTENKKTSEPDDIWYKGVELKNVEEFANKYLKPNYEPV